MDEQATVQEQGESEEWRTVVGFPSYEVSSMGKVRRVRWAAGVRSMGYILNGDRGGPYLRVCLRRDGKEVDKRVHELVAAAFSGPRPEGYVTHHLDGNKRNNVKENLAYLPNGPHYGDHLRGEKHPRSHLTPDDVREIRRRAGLGERHKDIGASFGIGQVGANSIINRRTWGHVQ